MSTFSHNKEVNKQALKYLYISLALLLIIIIYENFSHGVTSNYMRVTFLIPLIGGSLLTLILNEKYKANKFATVLWKMALATLVVGCFLYGVFEIYGSIEPTVYIYFYLGGTLSILSIIIYLVDKLFKSKEVKQ